eukprot:GFUD01009006.1.p1 GENE.GFUD01009006.1~~GFUD01009006.1.p1  ORF type:complete len:302 (+),score=89.01 GFUD01009006.1:133-1038(+)
MKRLWSGELPADSSDCLTVLQWNILAQTLGEVGDFCLCPEEALGWDHRRQLLVQEILSHKADIVCLEEVDCFEELSSGLHPLGYAGIWVPKPVSPCLKFEKNMGPDGNAIFFSREKFSLIKSYHHILRLEDGANTNSTVLICEVEHLKSGEVITILVTHLKAKESPEFIEERKNQSSDICKLVKEIKIQKKTNIILAGDFNASMEEPAYQLVRKAGMSSAYESVLGAEPEYTTWKVRGQRGSPPESEKKRTIDFVFYDSDVIKPAAVLQVPDEAEIGPGRLPNMEFPSDHMLLVVKFDILS